MGFKDLIVRAVKKDPEVEVSKKPKSKKKKKAKAKAKGEKSGWGTPVERYRRLCLLAQMCRFAYYVKATNIIPDELYDRVERVILRIEDKNRDIIDHRRSPTCNPGSDKADSYPLTVRSLWDFCGPDPRGYDSMQAVIEKSIAFAAESFGVPTV